MSELELREIVIEFQDRSRAAAITEEMPREEAQEAFDQLATALEESGPGGDRWLRVGKTVVVRAHEVHHIFLREPPYIG